MVAAITIFVVAEVCFQLSGAVNGFVSEHLKRNLQMELKPGDTVRVVGAYGTAKVRVFPTHMHPIPVLVLFFVQRAINPKARHVIDATLRGNSRFFGLSGAICVGGFALILN